MHSDIRRGSALITALFISGVLIFALLAGSTFLIHAIRRSGELVRAGQAFYFAEAGVERGLQALKHRGPGFETSGEEAGKYAYTVHNTATKIPEEAFQTLGLHETVTIPLFTDTVLGQKKVKGFLVEFFPEAPIPEKIDVLEWKLYGASNGKNSALADTVALSSAGSNASQPSCFGTSTSSCLPTSAWIKGDSDTSDFLCQGTHARKHYLEESSVLLECASIQSFVDEHEDNILVLRNIVNPAVISEGEPNVLYRVRTFDEKLPNLQARIQGTASIGNVTQTIEATLDAQKLQPVFEFAWYGK